MKHNLLVWTSHSCRRDVFLGELEAGRLPNYSALVQRGVFFSSAVVGGHFQRTSNLSEITGRPFSSTVHPRENILNAAAAAGATVGVVNDFIITSGARYLAANGIIDSVEEVYPRLIDRPRNENLGTPKIHFLPDTEPRRWLYWYRERATHRHFYNFALGFDDEGGFLVDVVNDNPRFVYDQQRYSLWLQDQWLGATLRHLEAADALNDTVIVVLSSHGSSIDSWMPLAGRATRGNVDHTATNFHPNVSRSFALICVPGLAPRRVDEWVSIMDLKPTLCRLLGIENLGGSAYEIDLLASSLPSPRLLADVSAHDQYAIWDTDSDWLLMYVATDAAGHLPGVEGLPTSPTGIVAFSLRDDPRCVTPRTAEFLASDARPAFQAEIERLELKPLDRG